MPEKDTLFQSFREISGLAPFGIHHCGDNPRLFASAYAETKAVFYDVGWGSDVTRCSADLPDASL